MPPANNSSIQPLRLAVIGAGTMGLRHMKAAVECERVSLSAIFDIHTERTQEAAETFGTHGATSLQDALESAEAAVIATPTNSHKNIAIACLQAGLHCLVEKPLASSETDCRELIDTAAVKNLVLQVGHSERFNPAVDALWNEKFSPNDISSIRARRLNPPVARAIEDDEILDLMVHDIDVILALKSSPIREVTAQRLGKEHSGARLYFADGSSAVIEASRSATERVRDLDVMTESDRIHVEYADRTGYVEPLTNGDRKPRRALTVAKTDPLQEQLTHFASCIRRGKAPRVTGEHALATLKLAWRIQAALGGTS